MNEPNFGRTPSVVEGLVFPRVHPSAALDARIEGLFTHGQLSRGATWLRHAENFTYSALGFGYAVCMAGYLTGKWFGY